MLITIPAPLTLDHEKAVLRSGVPEPEAGKQLSSYQYFFKTQ